MRSLGKAWDSAYVGRRSSDGGVIGGAAQQAQAQAQAQVDVRRIPHLANRYQGEPVSMQ